MGKTVSITIECKACNATGLYTGMAERDGAAVVCHACKGKGVVVQEGTEFEEIQSTENVAKVFHGSSFCISRYSRGGVSYEEWVDDPESVEKRGNELRDYQCPKWHYQSACYKIPMPLWDKCTPIAGQTFTSCDHFNDKHSCWEQLDVASDEKGYGDNLWKVDAQEKED